MNINLPATTRQRRDMTEKLLKATLNQNWTYLFLLHCQIITFPLAYKCILYYPSLNCTKKRRKKIANIQESHAHKYNCINKHCFAIICLLAVHKRICFGEAKTLFVWNRYKITRPQFVSYLLESIQLLYRIRSLQVIAKSVVRFEMPVCIIIGGPLVYRMKNAM